MVLRALAVREELAETLRRLAAEGLVAGTEGNASARAGELVAISPSGLAYETLGPEDVCLVTPDGRLVEGPRPSVELPMHLAVLAARPDAGAVVHTHSPHATAEPAVPVAEGRSGTAKLGSAVVAALAGGDAVVIRNHGPVCVGSDLPAALARAIELEEAARSYSKRSGSRPSR
ncbi:MAG: class II aldolase/adducin family protein [Gaiellaceae bacterium]